MLWKKKNSYDFLWVSSQLRTCWQQSFPAALGALRMHLHPCNWTFSSSQLLPLSSICRAQLAPLRPHFCHRPWVKKENREIPSCRQWASQLLPLPRHLSPKGPCCPDGTLIWLAATRHSCLSWHLPLHTSVTSISRWLLFQVDFWAGSTGLFESLSAVSLAQFKQ